MRFELATDHSRLIFPARLRFGDWADSLAKAFERLNVSDMERILVAASPSQTSRVSSEQLFAARVVSLNICEMHTVAELDSTCAMQQIQVLIAFGGGKVIDLCKAVAARRSIALIVIPSTLSSDCVASPVCVIKSDNGVLSLPGAIPSDILIDTAVLAEAPRRFLLAGIGDLLSNHSALADVADGIQGEVNDFATLVSETSVEKLLNTDLFSLTRDEITVQLAKGLILSGMAMGFAGSSAPCSGSEHLISHALDVICPGAALHGEQVAIATLYVAALRRLTGSSEIDQRSLSVLRNYCGYRSPNDIGINRQQFMSAVGLAHTMRACRVPFWRTINCPSALLEAAYSTAFDLEETEREASAELESTEVLSAS